MSIQTECVYYLFQSHTALRHLLHTYCLILSNPLTLHNLNLHLSLS